MHFEKYFFRWLPALLMMTVIFGFSSIPSYEMPRFDWADLIVKKGGHLLGYGLLALSYWYGLQKVSNRKERKGHAGGVEKNSMFFTGFSFWLAWSMAVLYAMTDEFHQSFVPGRGSSWIDVGIDALGAALILFLSRGWLERRNKRETLKVSKP